MSEFRFANPNWSAAIWVVIVIVLWLLWLERRRGRALSRFMSAVMQGRLVARPSIFRRSLVILLLGLSACCLVVAMMRPQVGLTYMKTPRVGAQIMFCLDVSKSMLAEDTAPNRLERAKADISDLLALLDGDQVGLIGFAGRASVLCPLTPDYGFFKLILDGANPQSVGRGGTRLEEPIRKAMDGFRTESDVARVVFLITDGEDHDSHPLDAAKEAIERGVKVVAVGLGDESGSGIRVTDPRTGVQSPVLDNDGNPVISRLDGETLRELALATEGVYIPAGTGNLDLDAIYENHIRPLVRGRIDAEGRAVRQDIFQWAVLAGIGFLMASLVVGSGRSDPHAAARPDSRQPTWPRAAMVPLAFMVGVTSMATAADPSDSTDANTPSAPATETSDPREAYNEGSRWILDDVDRAEDRLTQARREAGGDGEVRYRATYNMGWVEIQRADALIDEAPDQALNHLQRAAGWFRDAIRLRKDSSDARHNLEITLLRIMQLRDRLAQQDDATLEAMLDALIASQRASIGKLRELVEQIGASDDPNIVDQFRTRFQQLAMDQRVAMSDQQDVSEKAVGELSTAEMKPEKERSPEEQLRIAQLSSLLSYLNQSSQRLGQSRSQLRRRQASRSFRRAAAALNQLKRARDQLRDPLQILDGILADATTTAQHTILKMLDRQPLPAPTDERSPTPSWIDQDYLTESQSDLTQRTGELTGRLRSAWTNATERSMDDSSDAALSDEQLQFLELLDAAMPHLIDAEESMKTAEEKMGLEEYDLASEKQIDAINSLNEAREQFADLRSLIEIALATQSEILGWLTQTKLLQQESQSADGADPGETAVIARQRESILERVQSEQAKNQSRMQRLENLVTKESAEAAASNEDDQAVDPQQVSPRLQQLQLAKALVAKAISEMEAIATTLKSAEPSDSNGADPPNSKSADESDSDGESPLEIAESRADEAVETLTNLRRLFFSVVEHLQELAQRQAELNDDTEQSVGAAAIPTNDAEVDDGSETDSPGSTSVRSAEFASRQAELAQTASQISEALQQQAEASNQPNPVMEAPPGQKPEPSQQAVMQEQAQKAKAAADLVSQASTKMTESFETLSATDTPMSDARAPQDEALQKLVEALQQLQPPQQDQPPSEPQPDQQQPSSEPQPSNEADDQTEKPTESEQMNPSRLLQAVRDREAQRRRDQEERQRASQIPVEKDW
ncbi:MAG: VWA domain-containing protein [Planctomycetota bacterium]